MNIRKLKDVFDSIQLDGKEMDVENPQLELYSGQVHTLKLACKDCALWVGECGFAGLHGMTSLGLEVQGELREGTSNNLVEFKLTAGGTIGNGSLVFYLTDSDDCVVVPVSVESIFKRVSVQLESGEHKAGSNFGHVFVPSDEETVWLEVEFTERVNSAAFPENKIFRFGGSTYHHPYLWGDGSPLQLGVESLEVAYASRTMKIILEVYEPWATFSAGGVDHGKFLPIMMKANETHKISVRPLDSEENGTIGSYYGRPDFFDVLPEQGAKMSDVPQKSISIGALNYVEIGGPGKPERYIRLKSTAPMGAIPIYFRFSDGNYSGGLVNVERYE